MLLKQIVESMLGALRDDTKASWISSVMIYVNPWRRVSKLSEHRTILLLELMIHVWYEIHDVVGDVAVNEAQ